MGPFFRLKWVESASETPTGCTKQAAQCYPEHINRRRERNPSQETLQYRKPRWEKRRELLQKLQEDMKAAMKSGDKARLGVIRMLISDVKVIYMQPNKP